MRVYLLTWRADVEGEWCEPDPYGLYATEESAWAAWQRCYRGPDIYGARAYPEVIKMELDDLEEDGRAGWARGNPPYEYPRLYPIYDDRILVVA